MLLVIGTTCATVLTQAILTEGCRAVASGVNVMDLRNGINMAVDAVISHLKTKAWMISTPEEITEVNYFISEHSYSYHVLQWFPSCLMIHQVESGLCIIGWGKKSIFEVL